MKRELILVRHTRPAVGVNLCYGRSDVELAATWQVDVDECLAAIPVATSIITSPLVRCRMLASAIGRRDGLSVVEDPRLMELDFGSWEGRSWDDIPRADVEEWVSSLQDYAPGHGESLRTLWARVDSFREELLARYDGHVVVVSHHGPIRALAAQLEGRSPDKMVTCQVPWGGVRRVALPDLSFEWATRTGIALNS